MDAIPGDSGPSSRSIDVPVPTSQWFEPRRPQLYRRESSQLSTDDESDISDLYESREFYGSNISGSTGNPSFEVFPEERGGYGPYCER